MRKKNVLMSAIAALAFAACSSDDVLLEQDTGIVRIQQEMHGWHWI